MTLSMWTVYDHPKDYPDSYVARRFDVGPDGPKPTETMIAVRDLDVLREMLAFELHLTPLSRSPEDDPKILETWL